MSGPDKRDNSLDVREFAQTGKFRLTGERVSKVVVIDKKYSQSGPFVPGERVSRPYPPLFSNRKKDRGQPA